MIKALLATRRKQLACARLERIVSERRNSFEIRDYAKRRAAALKARPR